jgi:multiple sugar transport system substrate-binding protein
MPWKTNPVMVFYNKDVFQRAGIDATNPPLKTYAEFLTTSSTLVSKGGVAAAIWPSPTSEFYQPWFDFYPLFVAQTNGKRLIENGQPQFADADGIAVANFWKQMYTRGLSPKEQATGDAFAERPVGDVNRGPVGDRGLWRQTQLGCGVCADQRRYAGP